MELASTDGPLDQVVSGEQAIGPILPCPALIVLQPGQCSVGAVPVRSDCRRAAVREGNPFLPRLLLGAPGRPSLAVRSRRVVAGRVRPIWPPDQCHQIPTLVADGNDDALDPETDDELLASTIPGAQLVVYPDAGHAFLFQDSSTFVPRVEQFLQAQR